MNLRKASLQIKAQKPLVVPDTQSLFYFLLENHGVVLPIFELGVNAIL